MESWVDDRSSAGTPAASRRRDTLGEGLDVDRPHGRRSCHGRESGGTFIRERDANLFGAWGDSDEADYEDQEVTACSLGNAPA